VASRPVPVEGGAHESYARLRRDAWILAAIAVGLWIVLRIFLGAMPQWASYHDFADTRTRFGIPRAGDVLTNLAILAAGLWGWSIGPRAHLCADERPAFVLLVGATILTALGSANYHLAPTNPTLVWDRLPMALVMVALLMLLAADRIDGRHARAALAPLVVLGVAGVAWWGVTEALGHGDLLLYGVVRIGTMVMLAVLLLLWPGRTRGDAWLWASFVVAIAMMVVERFDREIYDATGRVVSGHNLKHVLAGVVIACMFGWLRFRRPRDGAP